MANGVVSGGGRLLDRPRSPASAKPLIDVILCVADSADGDGYVPALTCQDNRLHLREPEWRQHRVMKGYDPMVNLHVFTVGSPELARMVAFRDRCRAHPEEFDSISRQACAGRTGLASCPTLRQRQG
jgi:GrpB-like predicted nucleotidyltransferase (UPF0157 family)